MTYEMKDFQEDEKRLRKQAKDGEISEEEFFLALKKLHNRATEGDSHLVQLARSIGISEDELFSGEYGDNYDDILKNILDKAGITESKATEVSQKAELIMNKESEIMLNHGWRSGIQVKDNWDTYKSEMIPFLQTLDISGYDVSVLEDENYHTAVKLIRDEFGIRPTYIGESKASEGVHYTCPNCGNTDFSNESFEEYGEKRGSISCGNCGTVFTPMGDPTFGRRTVLGTVPKGQGSTYDILAKKYDWEAKANEMEEHECDDCGFKSVDYEEYKDHRKAHDKPVGSQGESIATEEEISDGIWLVDEEEQKELDKEKKRKEQNMNIDEDYMRSMGTVGSDEGFGGTDFKEEEHPRDEDGKFTSKGSGGSSQTTEKPKEGKTNPKEKKNFDNAVTRALKSLGEPKSDYDRKSHNKINNLDGFPQDSSQLRGVGVKQKAPILKAHLSTIYPDNKFSVRIEYYSGGSSINVSITGGDAYPYGADKIGDLYKDSGSTNSMVDYFDYDNAVSSMTDERENKHPRDPWDIVGSRERRFGHWIYSKMNEGSNWIDYSKKLKGHLDLGVTERIARTMLSDSDSTGLDDVKFSDFEDLKKEFLELEKKEGSNEPFEVKKATTPASYTQQYMHEDPDKPSEVPIDPTTKEELPVSSYNPNDSKYRKPKETDTKKDVTKAYGLMKGRKDNPDKPMWEDGEAKSNEHDSLCPYCSKQIDDDDHWFEHIEKHRNGESRHHEQIDVKKKWLERCEVCGDIRSSHTNGIDHKFEVDATGTEFVNPKYLEMLGESILFKKNVSVEMVRLSTMREAEEWWDKTHAGTHGRKYWKDMNIRERQKTILAYLETQLALTVESKLLEGRVSHVRKYALENKRIRFENPDPKFWWNDGEARTGTVLNEYRQSGLEWYSVNSGGQIYNVLKDDAELITGEVEEGLESCPECGNEVKDYLMKKHFENEHEEFINEHLWKDDLYLVENDHRNHSAIESDEEAKALLTDLTELDLLEDLKDNEKTEQTKGEDETEDLDLIEQLMDIEEDEIKEKIEEATPNSLIRYANPKKLPNGKTVMDRIRTSHPQVNESKLHSPIHISQYHQGDFSVTQICTECGLVIRGDPYSVDEESMQHVKETGHSTFKVEVEESIDVLGNIPFEAISTLAWNNLSPIIKEKIKQKISKEYWDDGTPTTTGEWWDMNDYEFKWSILKGFGSFAKSDELAKAYWRHLPDHVQNVVKRYRQIHFPDALGIEGISSNKNHNIDTYLKKSLQDYLEGKNSPNDEYEFGDKEEAKEDSLLKVEEKPEGVDVTVLDEWKTNPNEDKKAGENDLEGLIDMYSDTTSIPRNPTYPSEPLGSGTDTEECPFCGNSFDEFNLDHHVEQEHGVHTPSQYTQSTIMDNLNDEWLGEAWDKMSAKERRKLLGETKVECSRCGQPLEEDDKEGQDKHAKNRHSEQGQASDNLDIGKVEWVPLGTYKPMYESKASEGYIVFNADGITLERYEDYEELDAKHYAEIIGGFVQEIADDNFDIDKHYSIAVDGDLGDIIYDARDSLLKSAYSPESKASEDYESEENKRIDSIIQRVQSAPHWKTVAIIENTEPMWWEDRIIDNIKDLKNYNGVGETFDMIERVLNMSESERREDLEILARNNEYHGGSWVVKDDLTGVEQARESYSTEGGFGSGKKGHSAWMKDIEWGGNYKQCPICGINTNFTSGKCEICGNSFA